MQVIETFGEADEVADAVAVRILERLNMQLIDDGVLKPEFVIELLRRFSVEGRDDVHVGSSRHDNGTAAQGSCAGSMRRRRPFQSSRYCSPVTRFWIARTSHRRFPARSAHRRSAAKKLAGRLTTQSRRRPGYAVMDFWLCSQLRSRTCAHLRAQTNSPSARHVYHPAMRLPEMPPFLTASTGRTPLQSVCAAIAAADW